MDDPEQLIQKELGEEFEWKKLEKGLNTIYLLTSEKNQYILKIHTNPENKLEWFRAEPEIYEKISRETNVPSPEIVYKDLSERKHHDAFYVMEKLEGENPQKIKEELEKDEIENLVAQYGRILGKIHEIQISEEYGVTGFENEGFGAEDSAEQWNWALEGAMSAWQDRIEEEWENPPEIEFNPEKVKQTIPDKPEPVLIHSDNRLDNLLFREGGITGFLDWSHPWSAPREYDLIKTEIFLIERDLGGQESDEEKLKELFYESYREEAGLDIIEISEEVRKVYRYSIALELAAGFANWGSKLDDKEHRETRQKIIERIEQERSKELL